MLKHVAMCLCVGKRSGEHFLAGLTCYVFARAGAVCGEIKRIIINFIFNFLIYICE